MFALKLRLALAIGFLAMPALGTSATGVSPLPSFAMSNHRGTHLQEFIERKVALHIVDDFSHKSDVSLDITFFRVGSVERHEIVAVSFKSHRKSAIGAHSVLLIEKTFQISKVKIDLTESFPKRTNPGADNGLPESKFISRVVPASAFDGVARITSRIIRLGFSRNEIPFLMEEFGQRLLNFAQGADFCRWYVAIMESSLMPNLFTDRTSLHSHREISCLLFAGRGATAAVAGDDFPAMRSAFAVRGDVDDAEINAQERLDFERRRFGQVNRSEQEELASTVNEVALALDPVEALGLILAVNHADYLATSQRGQADLIDALETHVALIVTDGPVVAEDRADGLVAREAFARLADGTHSELSVESELLADREISEAVNRWLTEHASIEGEPRGNRCCCVERSHRVEQKFRLLSSWQQLHLQREFHCVVIRNNMLRSKVKGGTSSVA